MYVVDICFTSSGFINNRNMTLWILVGNFTIFSTGITLIKWPDQVIPNATKQSHDTVPSMLITGTILMNFDGQLTSYSTA